MTLREVLKKYGEKKAVMSVSPRSMPGPFYQPKLPVKVEALIKQSTMK